MYFRCDCLEGWIGDQHCEEPDNSTDTRLCTPGWMGDWCADMCLNEYVFTLKRNTAVLCMFVTKILTILTGTAAPNLRHCIYDK
jgi:hypothetical protein